MRVLIDIHQDLWPTPFGSSCQAYWLIKNKIIGGTMINKIIPTSGPNGIYCPITQATIIKTTPPRISNSISIPLPLSAQTQSVLPFHRGQNEHN